MPIATDPNQTFDVSLPADKDTPEPTRPTYVFRHLTARQSRACRDVWRGLDKEADGDVALDHLAEAIRDHLADWRNLTDRNGEPIPFDPAALEDTLTDSELVLLFAAMLDGNRLTPADLGNSASPSPTDSDKSAPEPTGEPADGAAATSAEEDPA